MPVKGFLGLVTVAGCGATVPTSGRGARSSPPVTGGAMDTTVSTVPASVRAFLRLGDGERFFFRFVTAVLMPRAFRYWTPAR